MEKGKQKLKIQRIRKEKSSLGKGVDTLKFCGVLKLKDSPMEIQKKLRDEWQ